MIEKTANEILEEDNVEEDEITMKVMKTIADTIMKHIETEYDCPSLHPELDNKVPVLDLGVWIENIEVAAGGLDVNKLHSSCSDDEICLPIGEPRAAIQSSYPQSYTTPVNRGFVPGRSNLSSSLSDTQLIQPPGSQVSFLQPSTVPPSMSAPHPTPSCHPPWSHLPLRPCSSATVQSQGRDHICCDRCDRRSRKFFVDCVNFSLENANNE